MNLYLIIGNVDRLGYLEQVKILEQVEEKPNTYFFMENGSAKRTLRRFERGKRMVGMKCS